MKKILNIFALFSLLFSLVSFAYSPGDVTNANALAREKIINDHSTDATAYNLDKNISRFELLVVALRIEGTGIPENYTCKGYYTDVKKSNICAVVETAADLKLVTRANKKFRPNDSITRAEALSIIVKASKIETNPENYTSNWLKASGFADWQTELLSSLPDCRIYNHGVSCEDGKDGNMAMGYFRPNVRALRSEVFEFLMFTPYMQDAQKVMCDDIMAKLLSNDVTIDDTLLWLDEMIDTCSNI